MQRRSILKKIFLIITCFLVSSIAISADAAFANSYSTNATTQVTTPVIKKFQSDITVEKNSTLLVTETIAIATDGTTIQHGIYRDFPTTYKTADNRTVRVSFNVKRATLNGAPVAFHTQDLANGVRVYLGDSKHYLPANTYVFSLIYTTSGQVGFFSDHDELYWNVTGNGWGYPIEQVEATVNVPDIKVDDITGNTAYTGYQGSREQHYTVNVTDSANVVFKTTQALAPHQGFTIVVGWRKGFVTQPNWLLQLGIGSDQVTMYLAMLAAIVIVLFYYLIVWLKYGRDQQPNTIIPQYYPPTGYTPAALRYILDMGYDDKVFTAAILNMAVKGFLKITQVKNLLSTTFVLTKRSGYTSDLSTSEQVIAEKLFANSDSVSLDKPGILQTTVAAYKASLKKEFSQLFVTNIKYVIYGILFSVAAILALLAYWPFLFETFVKSAIFMLVAGSLTLHAKARLWHLPILLIILWFIAQSLDIVISHDYPALIFMGIIFMINILFMRLLKRGTVAGNKIATDAKGFKMFLAATEKDQLNFRNPPDRTPELFEKYLPYALALGVEQLWCEHFAEQLEKLNYQPTWYVGTGNFAPHSFASNLGSSLQGAISSAATSPGSVSGFGGGGGSGGGGGGGGGGGW